MVVFGVQYLIGHKFGNRQVLIIALFPDSYSRVERQFDLTGRCSWLFKLVCFTKHSNMKPPIFKLRCY